ncbi:hypothetical protein CCACVL1_16350 [Corchorus capsularis]|uniref:Uncharacterized protein n=1 Tax=Corchorus capsularis TaxID=210143 RepID=A0A1R3HXM0_COCAP|nr:hypothetical protein CCACVL1_16350 [Corchorus capsularis]
MAPARELSLLCSYATTMEAFYESRLRHYSPVDIGESWKPNAGSIGDINLNIQPD